jgi:hypothetical protein
MAANSKADKSKSSEKKVFDVAKPGKSAPTTTTRPIIVGHKPMIQDPMVNASEVSATDGDTAENEKSVSVRSTKKIVPLHEKETDTTESGEENKDKNLSDKSSSDAADKPSPEGKGTASDAAAEEQSSTPSLDESEQAPTTNEAAAVDAFASQVTRKKDGELSEEEKKRAEAIQKLIEDKTYYVKIGQAHRSRNNTVLIILSLIIVVAVGLVVAIDAGLLQTNITLPFDLITN